MTANAKPKNEKSEFVDFLTALAVASIIGYLIANRFSWATNSVSYLVGGIPAIFITFMVARKFFCLICCIWLTFWLGAHSPKVLDNNLQDAVVVAGSGCGLIEDSLLVSSNGHLWTAYGRATPGDLVLLKRNPSIFTRPGSIDVVAPSLRTSIVCSIAQKFRSHLISKFEVWPLAQKNWLESFVLGASSSIDSVTLNALRKLGLLHIVVLSGGHLAAISAAVLFFVRFLPLLLFSLRIITMRTWPVYWQATAILSTIVVALFAFSVGLSQSIQRALLIFVIVNLGEGHFGLHSRWVRIKFAWVLQCILFPVNLFTLSTMLTWAGSLILNANITSRFQKKFMFGLMQDFKIQCLFAVLSLFVFGRIGLFSIVSNLVFGPLFSIALIANISLFFISSETSIAQQIVSSQMELLGLVRQLAGVQSAYPWLTISLFDSMRGLTWATDAIVAVFIFWLIQKIKAKSDQDP